MVTDISNMTYKAVAASEANARLTSSVGTEIVRLIIVPATTSPGTVILRDGSGSTPDVVMTFPGGATSVADLAPITVELNIQCRLVAASLGTTPVVGWHVQTGANVSVVAAVREK